MIREFQRSLRCCALFGKRDKTSIRGLDVAADTVRPHMRGSPFVGTDVPEKLIVVVVSAFGHTTG